MDAIFVFFISNEVRINEQYKQKFPRIAGDAIQNLIF